LAKKNRELIQKIHEVDSLKVKYEEAYAAIEPVGTLGTTSSKVLIYFLACSYIIAIYKNVTCWRSEINNES